MANVNLEDLKDLRAKLGMGMGATKAALEEANGDVEKATEILRLKGAKMNSKRVDRVTSEGLVAASNDGGSASMILLGCETDFVAKNSLFVALAKTIVDAVSATSANSVDSALAVVVDGRTVGELIEDHAAILGEKIELSKVATIRGEDSVVYLHRTSKDLPPQVGVVMTYSGDDSETARSIAQHIAVFNPEFATRDSVPAEQIRKERELLEQIARSEGKPEAFLQKIVEGKLRSFFERQVLVDQPYARDSKRTVESVLEDADLQVSKFARFKIGA